MERIFRIFGKEYGNMNQAALLLGSFAFLSQILGLFRDRAIAHFIGPGPNLDAYYAAFRIPDLIFISIASLVSITVLIPFLLQRMNDGLVTNEARKFLNDVFSVFLLTMLIVSIIVFVLMPYIVPWVAPGFSVAMQQRVVELSRIMLLSPVFLGLSNLFGSVTQLFKKFFIYSLSPVFYNFGIIAGIIFLYPVFGIHGLAVGVIGGACMHFLIQFFSSVSCGLTPKLNVHIDWQNIKQVFFTSIPRTLGLSFNNIALICIVSFASYLTSGSISIFNLSLNLQSVPLGIIGLSYAVAAFPMLTKSYSAGRLEEFKDYITAGAKQIIFWSLPITFLFIVLRAQIVRVILGSGSFSWENTRLVAASVAIFSISIVAQGLTALFARAYYAGGNTKRPLVVNFLSSVSIIMFSSLFLFLFKEYSLFKNFIESILKVSDIPGTAVLMLPLAYSVGTVINCTILAFFIKKDFMKNTVFISKAFFQSLAASFFLGLVSYLSLNAFSGVFSNSTFWGVFLEGFISGILGVIAGGIVLYLFKNEQLYVLLRALKTKFWKAKIIISEEEGL
jgi:putative peptidoglycan lipid II flippase